MLAIIQRVKRSSVKVENRLVSEIGEGLNILLGVIKEDSIEDVDKLVNKIVNLRIFSDENKKMNLSIKDIKAEALIISQFTLAADIKKGRRPNFENAMEPKEAKRLYDLFCEKFSSLVPTKKGLFGAMMEVEIVNDGPVTFIVDSKKL